MGSLYYQPDPDLISGVWLLKENLLSWLSYEAVIWLLYCFITLLCFLYSLHNFYCSFQNHGTIYPENDWKFKNSDQFEFALNTYIQSTILWNICKRKKKRFFLFFNNCLISLSILEKSRWMFWNPFPTSLCFL